MENTIMYMTEKFYEVIDKYTDDDIEDDGYLVYTDEDDNEKDEYKSEFLSALTGVVGELAVTKDDLLTAVAMLCTCVVRYDLGENYAETVMTAVKSKVIDVPEIIEIIVKTICKNDYDMIKYINADDHCTVSRLLFFIVSLRDFSKNYINSVPFDRAASNLMYAQLAMTFDELNDDVKNYVLREQDYSPSMIKSHERFQKFDYNPVAVDWLLPYCIFVTEKELDLSILSKKIKCLNNVDKEPYEKAFYVQDILDDLHPLTDSSYHNYLESCSKTEDFWDYNSFETDDRLVDKNSQLHIPANFPDLIPWRQRLVDRKNYSEIDPYYCRILHLVRDACDYWKSQDILNTDSQDEVPFNTLYFKKDPGKKIEKTSFIEMLDLLLYHIPADIPTDAEKCYYQAAKTLCMFHEESAKITDINDKKIKKYHQVARYFRNWSAHNKFEEQKMRPQEFALLFCITLRTYFDKKQENDTFTTILFDYEKSYFGQQDLSGKSISELNEVFSNLFTYLNDKERTVAITNKVLSDKSTRELGNIDSVLRYYGQTNIGNIPINFIFYSTVFKTDAMNISFSYNAGITQKDVTLTIINTPNGWFTLYNNVDMNDLKNMISKNGTDFEKLIMLQAYEILKDSNNS